MKLAGGDMAASAAAPLLRGEGAKRSGNAVGKGAQPLETAFSAMLSGARSAAGGEAEASPRAALEGKEPERQGKPAGKHPLPEDRPVRIVTLPEHFVGLRTAEVPLDPEAKAAGEGDGEEPGPDALPEDADWPSEALPPALPLVTVPLQIVPPPQKLVPPETAPHEKHGIGEVPQPAPHVDGADENSRPMREERLVLESADAPQAPRQETRSVAGAVTVGRETEAGTPPGERVSVAAAVSLWAIAGGPAAPAAPPQPAPLVAQATAPDLAAAIQSGLGARPAEGGELAARLAGSPRSLVIELRPAELGTVTARLRISGSAIEVDLQVETPEARDRLGADGGESILRALQALGIEVERVSVATSAPPASAETRAFSRSGEGAGAGLGGGQASGHEGSREGGRENAHGWQDGRQGSRGNGGARAQRGRVDDLFI